MNKDNASQYVKETNLMAQYLNQQYGKKFVVRNYRIEGSGLAVKGEPTADAYPTDNPAIRFEVMDRSNYKQDEHAYYNLYLQSLWSSQGKEVAEKFINAELPNTDGFNLEARPLAGSQLESYKSFKGRTLSLDEALSTYSSDVQIIFSVRSGMGASNNEPSTLNLERALKVFNYVAKTRAGSSGAYYLYKESDFNEKDKTGQQLYQYSIGASVINFDSINTANDLTAYFKKIR